MTEETKQSNNKCLYFIILRSLIEVELSKKKQYKTDITSNTSKNDNIFEITVYTKIRLLLITNTTNIQNKLVLIKRLYNILR